MKTNKKTTRPDFYPTNSLSEWDRRIRAAQQLCELMGVEFIGMEAPIAWARAIKRGDPQFLPSHSHRRMAAIRKHSKDQLQSLIDSLLT